MLETDTPLGPIHKQAMIPTDIYSSTKQSVKAILYTPKAPRADLNEWVVYEKLIRRRAV